MSAPPFIDRLSEIADQYDALLCDAWGVIHNGVRLFDGAAEAMIRFRAERGPVIILTNAPRPSSIIPAQLDRLGLPREAWDAVVTSGDATRAEIERRLPQQAWRLGPPKDDALYEGLDITFAPLEGASFIVCTGLVDDQRETPEDYRARLKAAARRGLAMVCANPDIVVNWGGRMIWCAGALAEIYKEYGGVVVYGGKPHRPIYDLALERVREISGAAPGSARILAVGDGLQTDILGADRMGYGAVFVAGGGGVHGGASHTSVAESVEKAGVSVTAVMEALRW